MNKSKTEYFIISNILPFEKTNNKMNDKDNITKLRTTTGPKNDRINQSMGSFISSNNTFFQGMRYNNILAIEGQ